VASQAGDGEPIGVIGRLMRELGKLPGIGPKSAERLAHHLLGAPRGYVIELADALSGADASAMEGRLLPMEASLHFASSSPDGSADDTNKSTVPDVQIPLRHLVSFLSAFPCFPPGAEVCAKVIGADGRGVAAHLLHKSQPYRVVSANELFSHPPFPLEDVSTSKDGDEHDTVASASKAVEEEVGEAAEVDEGVANEVLVVDARGDATLDLFARAWCSWKGEHAVIGRVKVTCLACCVREARAVGVRVVIRLE